MRLGAGGSEELLEAVEPLLRASVGAGVEGEPGRDEDRVARRAGASGGGGRAGSR